MIISLNFVIIWYFHDVYTLKTKIFIMMMAMMMIMITEILRMKVEPCIC